MKSLISLLFFSFLTFSFLTFAHAASMTSMTSSTNKQLQSTQQDIVKTLGLVPTFMKQVPESSLPAAWEEFKAVQLSTSTVIPPRIKELIGLAVAAQIPCKYCVYFHTEAAKANGATDEEIKEAVAMAGSTQHWSTFLNGIQYKEADYVKEVDQMVEFARKQLMSPPRAALNTDEMPPTPREKEGSSTDVPAIATDEDRVSQAQAATMRIPPEPYDAKSAYQDMEKNLGAVPEFVKQFPDDSIAGAWKLLKAVEYNPNTELTAKEKEMIGLAVAAQIPCKYCTYSHTESAKVNGASSQEISETLAMASVTRFWSTILNGAQVDEKQFKREVAQILKYAKAQKNKKVGMTAVTKK